MVPKWWANSSEVVEFWYYKQFVLFRFVRPHLESLSNPLHQIAVNIVHGHAALLHTHPWEFMSFYCHKCNFLTKLKAICWVLYVLYAKDFTPVLYYSTSVDIFALYSSKCMYLHLESLIKFVSSGDACFGCGEWQSPLQWPHLKMLSVSGTSWSHTQSCVYTLLFCVEL